MSEIICRDISFMAPPANPAEFLLDLKVAQQPVRRKKIVLNPRNCQAKSKIGFVLANSATDFQPKSDLPKRKWVRSGKKCPPSSWDQNFTDAFLRLVRAQRSYRSNEATRRSSRGLQSFRSTLSNMSVRIDRIRNTSTWARANAAAEAI
jgi:hypothetical protein